MSFMRVGDKVRASAPPSPRPESLVILEETRSDFPALVERADTGGSTQEKKKNPETNNHRKFRFQSEKKAKKTEITKRWREFLEN